MGFSLLLLASLKLMDMESFAESFEKYDLITKRIKPYAKQTKAKVATLRYYSYIGLLQPIHRGDNGYQYYAQNASEQVFIKKAQALGFTLKEILIPSFLPLHTLRLSGFFNQ